MTARPAKSARQPKQGLSRFLLRLVEPAKSAGPRLSYRGSCVATAKAEVTKERIAFSDSMWGPM